MVNGWSPVCHRGLRRHAVAVVGMGELRLKSPRTLTIQGVSGNNVVHPKDVREANQIAIPFTAAYKLGIRSLPAAGWAAFDAVVEAGQTRETELLLQWRCSRPGLP